MHIWLLTHSQELLKANGTGRLVKAVLGDQCHIVEWSRVNPPTSILELSPDDTLLIYPEDTQDSFSSIEDVGSATPWKNFIILDGTWQQARKIYNRSPYLHGLHKHAIEHLTSSYIRRRNQVVGGLCTAEIAIYLLEKQLEQQNAKCLKQCFEAFNRQTVSVDEN